MRLVATAGMLLFMALGVGVSALPAGADGGGNQNSHGQHFQGNGDHGKGVHEKSDQGNSGRQNCGPGQGQSWDHRNDHMKNACGTITLTKHVTNRRNPSDSFNIIVMTPNGKFLGTASTGTGNSATVGPDTVHPGAIFLAEEATPGSGTDLSKYQVSWACTDNGHSVKATPFDNGEKRGIVKVNVNFGENVVCTVTNQVPPVSVPFATPEAGIGLAGVTGLLGLGWVFARRRRRLAA